MTSIFNDFTNTQPQVQQSQNAQNQATKPIAVKEVMPQQEAKPDTVELSNKKTKKGPVKAVKGFIANVKKFFATVGEYTKGTVKGIANGVVAGSVLYTAGNAANKLRQYAADKAAKKIALETGEEFIQKAVKKFPSKIVAGAVAVVALAASLWNASLNATQKQSEIDMRWTGVETKK